MDDALAYAALVQKIAPQTRRETAVIIAGDGGLLHMRSVGESDAIEKEPEVAARTTVRSFCTSTHDCDAEGMPTNPSQLRREETDDRETEARPELRALLRLLLREPPPDHDCKTCPLCRKYGIVDLMPKTPKLYGKGR